MSESIAVFVFFFSLFCIFYEYFGYPVLLEIKASFEEHEDHLPIGSELKKTALVITMANEPTHVITKKILNTVKIKYPKSLFEVIIALDGTIDESKNFITNYAKKFLDNPKIVHSPEKQGKEAMQKVAVSAASDDVEYFVFTDVASELNEDCIFFITEHLDDPMIGVVDGRAVMRGTGKEGLYLRYENMIRELESMCSGIVTAGGCLFAAKKEVVGYMFEDGVQSDFGSVLVAQQIGLKSIIDNRAVAIFDDLSDTSKEFSRKRRTVLRGMNTLKHFYHLLNPFEYGFFSFELFSHKIMRWMVPFFGITATLSALFLPETQPYPVIAFAYLLFLVALSMTRIGLFLFKSNFAILLATLDFIQGKNIIAWNESVRTKNGD